MVQPVSSIQQQLSRARFRPARNKILADAGRCAGLPPASPADSCIDDVCSTITTASAPAGSGAPVMMPTACPRPTVHNSGSGQSPAFTSPTTSSRAGISATSAARTAYPSRVARAKGGKSRSATNPLRQHSPQAPPADRPSPLLPETRRPHAARPDVELLQSSITPAGTAAVRKAETCKNHTPQMLCQARLDVA